MLTRVPGRLGAPLDADLPYAAAYSLGQAWETQSDRLSKCDGVGADSRHLARAAQAHSRAPSLTVIYIISPRLPAR